MDANYSTQDSEWLGRVEQIEEVECRVLKANADLQAPVQPAAPDLGGLTSYRAETYGPRRNLWSASHRLMGTHVRTGNGKSRHRSVGPGQNSSTIEHEGDPDELEPSCGQRKGLFDDPTLRRAAV